MDDQIRVGAMSSGPTLSQHMQQQQQQQQQQQETEASLISKAATNSYPFLVHSTDTLANNRPPNVDNKPLARQKRRRTSPEDQKILEEAYALNPKPDKTARIDLVSRVALGEKEVQIWFQNRRQSSRRKTKPLEPHEIAQYQDSHSSPLGLSFPADPRAARAERFTIDQEDATTVVDGESLSQDRDIPSASQNVSTSFVEVPSSQPPPSSEDAASKAGYLSNRRNNASFRSEASQDDQPADSQEPPPKRLRKSDSKIRLSMTADGVARVMEGDEMSSPPRQMPPPLTPGIRAGDVEDPDSQSNELHRTQSIVSMNDTPGSQESTSSLRRRPSGRSRDSRIWSFFADRGGRSELEERAQQEASGDAAEAISILRQQEKDRARNPLMRVPSLKRYNPQSAPSSDDRAVKRLRQSQSFNAPSPSSAPAVPASTPFRQPLLQRSSSARNLQSTNRRIVNRDTHLLAKTPKLKQSTTFEIPATDSDKENWSPGDRPSAFVDRHFLHQMQTSPAVMPSTIRRPRAQATAVFHETPAPRRGRHAAKSQVVVHLADDDDDQEAEEEEEEDEEVSRFMSNRSSVVRRENSKQPTQERDERQSSEEEDLDCVQGLLKLSQGHWNAAR